MSTYRLKNLLSPHSVALVGASPRHRSVGRAILNNIRKVQFKGEFGLVNPRYHEIDGVATVGSIAKLAFAPAFPALSRLATSSTSISPICLITSRWMKRPTPSCFTSRRSRMPASSCRRPAPPPE